MNHSMGAIVRANSEELTSKNYTVADVTYWENLMVLEKQLDVRKSN